MRRRWLTLFSGALAALLCVGGLGAVGVAGPRSVTFELHGSYGRNGAFEIALGDLDLFIVRYGTEAPNEVWLNGLE